jgi:undecaprenyl-diphosphatase
MVRVAAWGGALALAVGTFAAVTQQMVAGRHAAIDRAILVWVAGLRAPPLTVVMVGVTTLGSPRPFTVLTLVALAILIALRDRRGVIHLAAAGLGTWILETATKGLLERARPTEVVPLVQVSGYSYPSGHALAAASLYLTMAIVAGRYLRGRASKVLLIAGAFALITMIAVSRVYLGVHYPSDVVSGISLGTAWALLLSAVVGAVARDGR